MRFKHKKVGFQKTKKGAFQEGSEVEEWALEGPQEWGKKKLRQKIKGKEMNGNYFGWYREFT